MTATHQLNARETVVLADELLRYPGLCLRYLSVGWPPPPLRTF
jgi:hypothetical protein